jgi:hypothetical protein
MRKSVPWLEVFLGPGRFWAGTACVLSVVGGIAYTYGLWYGGVLTADAAPVREVALNSSWAGRFQYEADSHGILWRVYRNAPPILKAEVTYDDLVAPDPTAASPAGGASVQELGSEKKTESQPKPPPGISHDELLAKLRATGTIRGEAESPEQRVNTVVVGQGLSEPDARALASKLRGNGRPATLVPSSGPGGSTVYTVQSGAFASSDQADAYREELRGVGIIQGAPGTGGAGAGGGTGTIGSAGSGGGAAGSPSGASPGGAGPGGPTKGYAANGEGATKSDGGNGPGPTSDGTKTSDGGGGSSNGGGRRVGDL